MPSSDTRYEISLASSATSHAQNAKRSDATIEYYYLVPSEYRNVPSSVRFHPTHQRAVSAGAVTSSVADDPDSSSPVYATMVDSSIYPSSVMRRSNSHSGTITRSPRVQTSKRSHREVNHDLQKVLSTVSDVSGASILDTLTNKELPEIPSSFSSTTNHKALSVKSDRFSSSGPRSSSSQRRSIPSIQVISSANAQRPRSLDEAPLASEGSDSDDDSSALTYVTVPSQRPSTPRDSLTGPGFRRSSASFRSWNSTMPLLPKEEISPKSEELLPNETFECPDDSSSLSPILRSLHPDRNVGLQLQNVHSVFPSFHDSQSAENHVLRSASISPMFGSYSAECHLLRSASASPVSSSSIDSTVMEDIYCPFTSDDPDRRSLLPTLLSKFRGRPKERRVFGTQSIPIPIDDYIPFPPKLFPHENTDIVSKNQHLPDFGPDWIITRNLEEAGPANSAVYACRNKIYGGSFIIKRIFSEQPLVEKHGRVLLNEIKILALLHDISSVDKKPFLLGPSARCRLWAWRDDFSINLVTDTCEHGCIRDFAGKLGDFELRLVIAQITLGLEALHAMGIVHNDICPENIYIHQDGNIRISGFHASQFIRRGKSLSRSETETTFLSRIEYSAPEVWVYNAYGLASYDQAVDYWSLGMTIFTLVTGSSLFDEATEQNRQEVIQNIRRGPGAAYDRHKIHVSDQFYDLMTRLLDPSPFKRIKGKEVKKHEYFTFLSGKWKNITEMKYFPPFERFRGKSKDEIGSRPSRGRRSAIASGDNRRTCNLIDLLHSQGLDVESKQWT